MSFYTDKVLDHFLNPRNVGDLPDADGVGTIGDPECGDYLEIRIKVKEDRLVDLMLPTARAGGFCRQRPKPLLRSRLALSGRLQHRGPQSWPSPRLYPWCRLSRATHSDSGDSRRRQGWPCHSQVGF